MLQVYNKVYLTVSSFIVYVTQYPNKPYIREDNRLGIEGSSCRSAQLILRGEETQTDNCPFEYYTPANENGTASSASPAVDPNLQKT